MNNRILFSVFCKSQLHISIAKGLVEMIQMKGFYIVIISNIDWITLKNKNMKKLKKSLENMQGKMSRKEMRNIMAGSNWDCTRNGGSFSTDSAELAAAWAAAWNSMGGNAECRHYYSSQPPGYA